jgi:hypothetical protein
VSSGVKRGSVINRSIEEQIASALHSLGVLVQPSRHRDEHDRIFGLDVQPDVILCYYNDCSWHKRLLADFVGEKGTDPKVIAERPKKRLLRGRQISYNPIGWSNRNGPPRLSHDLHKSSLYHSHHLIEHGGVIISYHVHFRKYCSPGSGNLIFRSRFENDVKNPLPAQMEKLEQCSVIKLLFLKGFSANAISWELSAVIGPTAYSLSRVKKWCVRFTEGDLTSSDQTRTGRPHHTVGDGIEPVPTGISFRNGKATWGTLR